MEKGTESVSGAGRLSAGARLRAAVEAERPLQMIGAINAYHARMAERVGYRALYVSGGGVAAGSLGLPDLGISELEDVLVDVRRITAVCSLPLLVDVDTGFGSAFSIARTVRSLIREGAGGCHIEDQVQAKRCGHRPDKEVVHTEEMVDRIKAAVDARTDSGFVIMARTDALAIEGLERGARSRLAVCRGGRGHGFPEAMTELGHVQAVRGARRRFRCWRISRSSGRRRCIRWRSCARREWRLRCIRCRRFAR